MSTTSYRNYLKDNPEKYWFKRKRYGWGWTPARWQGWLVLGVYIVALIGTTAGAEVYKDDTELLIVKVIIPSLALTFLLICSAWYTGEPPRCMWGPSHSNKDKGARE